MPFLQEMASLPPRPWHFALFWLLALGILAGLSLWVRTLFPVDETRYASVAWEMWQRGDLLVPFKNGEPYSHKPPLLFWLIHAGWALFGVNEWWPRLIAPLLSFAGLGLTWRLARRLWPDQPEAAPLATAVLLSSGLWMAYSQALMFDLLIAACTLLGILALVETALSGHRRWWGLFALAVGLGILAKGPAILVHLLPAALFAPWWLGGRELSRRAWYLGLLAALLGGIAIALAWAIPAGLSGGEAYRNAIFWGQTANRMVSSFAHQRPFWWYLPLLPLLLAPWLLWPKLWRGLYVTFKASKDDRGVRLLLLWFLSALLIFSLISGKQVHYLLPEFPAAALLLGLALARGPDPERPLTPALALCLLGVAILLAPRVADLPGDHHFIPAGLGLLALGVLLLFARGGRNLRVIQVTLISLAAFGWLLLTGVRPLAERYDLHPLAQELARQQAAGYQIGYPGFYHAQFHFLGRLTQPIEEINAMEAAAWLEQQPKRLLVLAIPDELDATPYQPLFIQPYRSRYLLLLDPRAAEALRRRPMSGGRDEGEPAE